MFTQLLAKHADFHETAGPVACKINAGQYAEPARPTQGGIFLTYSRTNP